MGDVQLPALGESVTEGTVTRWLKRVGDTVAVDEPLVEISTDKVDTEIPSPFAGVLQEILVSEDETVAVGSVLARIGEQGAQASAAPVAAPAVPAATPATPPVAVSPAASESHVAPAVATPLPAAPSPAISPIAAAPVVEQPAFTPPVSPGGFNQPEVSTNELDASYVTPIVRKLAQDLGVDLAAVQGTGVGGRIRKEDVTAYAESRAAAGVTAPAVTAQPAVAAPAAVTPNTQVAPSVATPIPTPVSSPVSAATSANGEPMSRLRRVLAERAVASMQQTAQLSSVVEADVTALAKLRNEVKDEFLAKTGNKLSFMPFFTLAAAEALQNHAIINSSVDGDNIVYHANQNISFAVDTERGLLTPVIRQVSSLSVAQLAAQIADLAARTRSNQLKPDELSGGTFTITNTGSRGALFDTPIVFLPQVAILGTGVVVKRPAVVTTQDGTEMIGIRSFIYLALSYDHRVIDGADAARYLQDVKERLEKADFRAQLGI
jgi:2-oxoglutarate dehydrogenase E2 component (dihydrolipoamide succinyltransferase)